MDFILGLGLALPIVTSTGVSTVTGVAQGVSQQQKMNEENANNESRMLKFHLDVRVDVKGRKSHGLDGSMVVMKNDKVLMSSAFCVPFTMASRV